MTKIEWTEKTWNPVVGCTILSPGCTNCYAMKMAARIARMSPELEAYGKGLTQDSKAGPVWTGNVAWSESAFLAPLRRKKPTTYFVNSMSDLFHESVPDEWIDRVFAVMALAPQHTFQVLTKRAKRMREYMVSGRRDAWSIASDPVGDFAPLSPQEYANRAHVRVSVPTKECFRWESVFSRFPLPNVWLGVSAEDQKRADERVPDLLATPAAVRFVSAEPLLGPIDFARIERIPDRLDDKGSLKRAGIRINALTGHSCESGLPYQSLWNGEGAPPTTPPPRLDWIIVGGESGPSARPMHPDWPRAIRDQCAAAGVAFFFKQWGSWTQHDFDAADRSPSGWLSPDGTLIQDVADVSASLCLKPCHLVFHVGKTRAGRLLDGRTHDDMPARRA